VSRFVAVLLFVLLVAGSAAAQTPQVPAAKPLTLVPAVRQAIAEKNAGKVETLLAEHRKQHGPTSEWLAAKSWVARDRLAAKQFDEAASVAEAVYAGAEPLLAKRVLDQDAHLQTAVGAAIEVIAQADTARNARSEAVTYLRSALATYKGSTIEKRIQKNLNMLSLEGTVAPALETTEYLGAAPPTLAQLKGKVIVLFFWAHWCADCKAQGPILAELANRYAADGLVVVAPTQRFGYVAKAEPAPADVETRYIEQVRQQYYPDLAGKPIPISEANHRRYGVSTTPTLVLVDRAGIVRLYNPGKMTKEALDPHIQRLLGTGARPSIGK
jgi:thiol-disulfide isomerase/thioredoxin